MFSSMCDLEYAKAYAAVNCGNLLSRVILFVEKLYLNIIPGMIYGTAGLFLPAPPFFHLRTIKCILYEIWKSKKNLSMTYNASATNIPKAHIYSKECITSHDICKPQWYALHQ